MKSEEVKSCIAVYVPIPQIREYRKVHEKLVSKLEAVFTGSHVVIIAWVGHTRIVKCNTLSCPSLLAPNSA